MWFRGHANIQRFRLYELASSIGKLRWDDPVSPYDTSPLRVTPWEFAYAATRASITGPRVGLRGQLAGGALSVASLSYLSLFPIAKHFGPSFGSPFLHKNIHHLKDFLQTTVKGTIGAAFTFLEMQALGYPWFGHWEDCTDFAADSSRPDFVYASPSAVCLVDAKGSRSSFPAIERKVKDEWRDQIFGNSGLQLKFGGYATEGRVIASALSHVSGTSLVMTYGKLNNTSPGPIAKPSVLSSAYSPSLRSVWHAHFSSVFYLLGLNEIAAGFLRYPFHNMRAALFELRHVLQTATNMAGGSRAFVGPVRLGMQDPDGGWQMRPFCRVDVLTHAVIRLLHEYVRADLVQNISDYEAIQRILDIPLPDTHPDLPFPQTERITPVGDLDTAIDSQTQTANQIVVQSRDGVGAIFTRERA